MSIEQQTENHVASPNIQSLTGLSAEEIAEEVDLFFAQQQPANLSKTKLSDHFRMICAKGRHIRNW
jgi:hypothetical protein